MPMRYSTLLSYLLLVFELEGHIAAKEVYYPLIIIKAWHFHLLI